MRNASLTAAGILVGLSACAPSLSQNPPREPALQLPATYPGEQPLEAQERSAESLSGHSSWRQTFTDPKLQALIETALQNNQELNIRLQEMVVAQAEVMARRGEYLPRVDARVGTGVEKVGKHTSQGASDEAHGLPENLASFSFGFVASWEVDIWKRLRNSAQAGAYRYLASAEGRNFMLTRLVAEIASAYYELVALDRQLEVLERNIAVQGDALEVVRFEKQAARVTELAVQRFEAELLKNRSRRFVLLQSRQTAENELNFLLGRLPQPVPRDARALDAPAAVLVEAGIPSALLENRPDVRQAELELQAAKLDVKAAKARFYPALSIEAGVGYEAFNARHLLSTPQSLLYNLAGNLTAPLLNRKAIEADYLSANARQLQAVFNYERALLRAFTDVANQLARLRNLGESYKLGARQVELLTQAIEVSSVLFQSARADYMEVLLTRRDALDAEMELIETRLAQQKTAVGIYQALGGGFR